MKYRIFALLLYVLYLSACSQKVIQITKIKDLEQLPQDALIYIDESSQIKVDSKALAVLKNDYLEKYYSIWQEKPNPNVNEVFWIKPSLLKNPGFGENLQANPLSYTKEILDSMDIESYPSKAIRAIITTTTDVRAVPT
ncbi:NlpC/P60 family N-terminal domain-containing protein, partial [uncultured Helicobacter sp.]